ncbi:MAG TPA: response regulator [Thermodesulfobacteriota bacterium]|nr:response regulator [Thermodesulfobacteriota bacterium]
MAEKERKKILIVEPDQKLAKKIYLILRQDGLIANTTEHALESIRTIQKEHISVLVFDVDVKDMAWDAAIAIIKEIEPGLPIIITSTHNTPDLEARILRQKPFYYHVKSFGTEELLLAVQNAIEKSVTR